MKPGESLRKSLGLRLEYLRDRAGYSPETLARALKISRNTIYRIERGVQWIGSDLLERMAALLGVPVAAFFEEKPIILDPTPKEAINTLIKALNIKF